MIFGAVNYDGIRRTRCHSELYTNHTEPEIVKLAKIERLGWVGHSFKTQRTGSLQKALSKREEKPHLGWPESAEEDMRNWRRKAQDREQWRAIVEEAKVHQRL